MDRFKFRAYPTEVNSDKTIYEDWQDTTLVEVYGFDGGTLYDVVQFTGLQDNDGNDYYLGNIIQTPVGSVGVLVWFDDCFGIGSGEANNYHAIDQTTKYELSDCRIIGNIHKNPDLLC